ncbi:pre-mRNA-splicing factor 18 [Candida albicans P76055]|nr:pre-mRNA-splicing factor 18 [Candida albicans P76055]
MDFSNLLSNEINKKRKKVAANGRKRSKVSTTAKEPAVVVEHAPETINPQPTTTNDEPSEEQLDTKLSQFGELDTSLSKSEKARKLQLLLQQQIKNTKYKAWLDQEAPLYQDLEKQLITLDLITDITNKQDEVYLKLSVYIKQLIKQWQECDNDDQELLMETKKSIVKLLYKLRSHKLSLDMLISLSTIVYYIQQNEFNKANESYMKLSIGNVCWPIGVVNVGIHARSAASKITGASNVSNIMLSESTRRWIISIKRLISFKERVYNNARD